MVNLFVKMEQSSSSSPVTQCGIPSQRCSIGIQVACLLLGVQSSQLNVSASQPAKNTFTDTSHFPVVYTHQNNFLHLHRLDSPCNHHSSSVCQPSFCSCKIFRHWHPRSALFHHRTDQSSNTFRPYSSFGLLDNGHVD